MKMSDKLKLIESILDDFIPSGNLEMKLYNDLRSALAGKVPAEVERRPHRCIYDGDGLCRCGFRIEDHDKNYPPPEFDVHGLKVGSDLYKQFYNQS